jgi:hypothetical protein
MFSCKNDLQRFQALLQQNLSSENRKPSNSAGFLIANCWQQTNLNSVGVANYGLQIDTIKFREFSLGVPTRDLGFGFEIRPFSVNRPVGELVPKELAFSRENSRYSLQIRLSEVRSNKHQLLELFDESPKIGEKSLSLSVSVNAPGFGRPARFSPLSFPRRRPALPKARTFSR